MAHQGLFSKKQGASMMMLLGLLTASSHVAAQERAGLEQLQATTMALIDVMVENGLITREKADKLLASAKAKAQAQLEAQAKTQQAVAAEPEVGKDGKKVVRVPYVPESLKIEMRDQIKQEVLAQARNERWGEPGAMPSWLNRFKFEGDMRLRYDMTRLSSGNTAPGFAYLNGDLTRAADMVLPGSTSNQKIPNFNTQDDFSRLRLRARLGATATVTDQVTAAMRFSTGNTTERTSTNQTLGQSFNKYQVVLDQAYVTVRPYKDLVSVSGGRMPNPFFGTDLVWADDLGFEGIAGTYRTKAIRSDLLKGASAFVTAGWFPLTESKPGTSKSRDMFGVQAGLEANLGRSDNRLKLGIGLYDYRHIEGSREDQSGYFNAPDYVLRSEYPSGFRQRGNTLFRLNYNGTCTTRDTAGNNITSACDANNNYGLASSFRELNLTASLDLVDLLPQRVIITGDFVKNIGFNRKDILQRTGVALQDGKDFGFMAKVQVGEPQITKRGQWNASLAYRYLGSDAVLDAFTNSDFGLGGTNNKGFVLGFNYGLYDNAWFSARWLSSNLIDSMAPDSITRTKLAADALWFELNFRF
jgi:hypothetical protein